MQISPFTPYGPTNYLAATTTATATAVAPGNFPGTAASLPPAPPYAGAVNTIRFVIANVATATKITIGFSSSTQAQATTNCVTATAGTPANSITLPALAGVYDYTLPAATWIAVKTDAGTADIFFQPGDGGR